MRAWVLVHAGLPGLGRGFLYALSKASRNLRPEVAAAEGGLEAELLYSGDRGGPCQFVRDWKVQRSNCARCAALAAM